MIRGTMRQTSRQKKPREQKGNRKEPPDRNGHTPPKPKGLEPGF